MQQNKIPDTLAFASDGTPISILKRKAKAFKKSENLNLGEAQDEIARQHGFKNWSQLSAIKLHPISENNEIIGFWQRLDHCEHEIYIDQLYAEMEYWPNDQIESKIFIKVEIEDYEGKALYVSSLHFKYPDSSVNEKSDIKQVDVDDIQALSDFLIGGMTARQIMSTLGTIGIFELDPRKLLRAKCD